MTTCPVFKARILSPVNPLPAVEQIEPVVPSFLRELRISCGALQLSASIRSFICFSSPSTNFQRTMRSDLSAHKPSSRASRSRTPRSDVNVNRTSKGSLPFPERTIEWFLWRLRRYDWKRGSRMHRLEMKCEEMLFEVSEFRQRLSKFCESRAHSDRTYARPHDYRHGRSQWTRRDSASLEGREGGRRTRRAGHGRQELWKGEASQPSPSQSQDRGNTAGGSGRGNRRTNVTHGIQTQLNSKELPQGTTINTRDTHSRRTASMPPDEQGRPYDVTYPTSHSRFAGDLTVKSEIPIPQSADKTDYSVWRPDDDGTAMERSKDAFVIREDDGADGVGTKIKRVSFAPRSLSEKDDRLNRFKSAHRNRTSVSPMIWPPSSQQGTGGHRRWVGRTEVG